MKLGSKAEAGGLLKETAAALAKGPFPLEAGAALDLWRLADAFIILERFDEARPLIDQALEIDRKLFPEGLGTARDLNLLSVLSFAEGNLVEAERHAREGLLIISRNAEPSETKDQITADLRRNYLNYLEKFDIVPDRAAERVERLLKGEAIPAPAPLKGEPENGAENPPPKSSL
jgi:tetratricopeptide (TPR) repeat protein